MTALEWLAFGALCAIFWPVLSWLGSLSRRRPTKRDKMTPAERAQADADVARIVRATEPAPLEQPRPHIRAGSTWNGEMK